MITIDEEQEKKKKKSYLSSILSMPQERMGENRRNLSGHKRAMDKRGIPYEDKRDPQNFSFTPTEAGAGLRNIVSGAADWGKDMLVRANDTVRNTSPVREMYGAAELAKGFIGGNEEPSTPATPELAPKTKALFSPEGQVVTEPGPIFEVDPVTNKVTSRGLVPNEAGYNDGDVVSRSLPTIQDASAVPQQVQPTPRKLSQVDGLPESTSPNLSYSRLIDADGKDHGIRETYNGPTNSAPATEKAFVSAKRFKQRVGWDSEGRPIYNDGSAAMRAANSGIATNNANRMRAYEAQNKQFAEEHGDIPLAGAQTRLADMNTNLTGVQLKGLEALSQARNNYINAETPKERAQAERILQAYGKTSDQKTQKPDVKVIQVPDGLGGTKEVIMRDDGSGNYVNAMADQTVTDISSFTQAQKAKAVAYGKANPNVSKSIILQKIASGEI